MSRPRMKMDKIQEMVRLHRMGTPAREVARLAGMSPTTERKYRKALQEAGLLQGDANRLPESECLKSAVDEYASFSEAVQQQSSVKRWGEKIEELHRKGNGPRAIFDFLRLSEEEFDGSLSAVKRYCVRLRKEEGFNAEDVAIPVETGPGEVAQVDFGYVGKLYDPTQGRFRKSWVFVMVLSHSRHMYADLVFDQKSETWSSLHVDAFSFFGGAPRTVVPDNLKAAVIRRAFGTDNTTALNRSYRELARHYSLKIDPTPPRAPEKKGKVEAAVKYVKRSFFKPREGKDYEELRGELRRWVEEIAGRRTHGTTGKRPLKEFEETEKDALQPLPATRFEPIIWKEAKIHKDSHVCFDGRLYSAPWLHIGKKVWLRVDPDSVKIYLDEIRIATHSRHFQGLRSTRESHLPEHRGDLRNRGRNYWEERAYRIGREVGDFIIEVFDSDEVLSQLRTVQAIVCMLEKFPTHRAMNACRRASYFGNYSYKGIKNILNKALDLTPIPETSAPAQLDTGSPRFARSASELSTGLSEDGNAHK